MAESPQARDRSRSRSPLPASQSRNGRHASRSPLQDKSPRRDESRSLSRSRSPSPSQKRSNGRTQSISPHKSRSRSRSPSHERDDSKSRSKSHRRPLSRSPSPVKRSRSKSPQRDVSRSKSKSNRRPLTQSKSPSPVHGSRSKTPTRDEVANPGNTLFVTGLSTRVDERDLKRLFSKEGKVVNCNLVVQPQTRLSRGFAFVTMDTLEDADRCIKYLDQSILDGRKITIEKSKRKRPRTPTPGNYLGFRKPSYFRDRPNIRYRDSRYGGDYYDRDRYSRGHSTRRSRSRSYSRSPY